MKQHLNPKSSHMVAAFVPLEKLMCWKETRNKKEKGQKENGERSGRGKNKKHETGTRYSKAKNVLKTTC